MKHRRGISPEPFFADVESLSALSDEELTEISLPDSAMHPALGIDYGEARIGVAATDAFGILPHPVESINRQQADPFSRIAELVQERGIRTLVLGYPLRLDGSEGSACEKVRTFGEQLHARFPGLPLIYVDEFLTTSVAQQKLHAAGKKARDFRPIIDQAAAVEILNNWLRSPSGLS